MIKLLYFIIFSFLFISNNIEAKSDQENANSVADCSLYSDVYYEYLYAANFIYSKFFKRAVYTWRPYSFWYQNRYDTKLEFTEKDRKGIWSFEPVEGQENIFYLKNNHYNEYMYTSQYRVSLFLPQRLVFTNNRIKPEYRESYMWRLEKENEHGRYVLWNVKYNEPLYPSSQMDREKSHENMRDVFTWPINNDRAPSSFYWTLKCKNDIYPL